MAGREAINETVTAVDLFCGGGGLSTALAEACEDLDRDVELVAVNHWGKAIETHKKNHPWATHLNAKVEELHPPDVVEPDTVDILIAAPECTHFSTARGGKPVKEQQRASPTGEKFETTMPWHRREYELAKLDPAAMGTDKQRVNEQELTSYFSESAKQEAREHYEALEGSA